LVDIIVEVAEGISELIGVQVEVQVEGKVIGFRVVVGVVFGTACAQAVRPNKITTAINLLTTISFSRALLPYQNILKFNQAVI
jgi:hypothetical protein